MGARVLWGGLKTTGTHSLLYAHTPRGRQLWLAVPYPATAEHFIAFFERLLFEEQQLCLVLTGCDISRVTKIQHWLNEHSSICVFHPASYSSSPVATAAPREPARRPQSSAISATATFVTKRNSMNLTHLQRLEAESIHIMREVVAEADNPVMLYSIGKDSAVMLHLAMKAFYPSVPPFPLLHVDTRWKFREMYEFRDHMAKKLGMELLVHVNPEAIEKDINPFTHGSAIHTDITKTEGLKQALDKYGFDAAFGGARRDEEKSRAKERIFSFRTAQHRWDPKNQRPELWKQYNARKHKGESIRVFPLSNWTELDIWQYIHLENIPIVPLYYAAQRPVVERDGTLIMVDDERMPLKDGEVPMMKHVRFRTLGCYPLTGAVESEADTLPAIIQEMLLTKTSERQGRMIDHDSAASMEKKKQEGYF
ncbi:sulfate adenylyltransferase subunit CysD [Oceanimonas sp. GK1]|uniref:sulfate adenylyltransferase subunit CysD n=2 Tax=Oceanimonas sp. (strain GK1 / IBRC-M 10197) TaxID=511062 RepID=UPI003528DC27